MPATVETFVRYDLTTALYGEPHEVAAAFCYGRELLLPDVLRALRGGLGEIPQAATFVYYLDRHIAIDQEQHGPTALRLLDSLCDGIPERLGSAEEVAIRAVENRIKLWDGVVDEIRRSRSA